MKHTAEEVRYQVEESETLKPAERKMLTDYAYMIECAERGVTELPDEIRVPLDEVRADLGYLFGRVAADGSFMQAAVDSVRVKLDKVSAALLAVWSVVPAQATKVSAYRLLKNALFACIDEGLDQAMYGGIEYKGGGAKIVFSIEQPTAEQVAQVEEIPFPMTEQQVQQWLDACNYEPARKVLRDYLSLREDRPRTVPDADDWSQLKKAMEDWGDGADTDVPRHTLMRLTDLGLLVAEQFDITKKGMDFLAADKSPEVGS